MNHSSAFVGFNEVYRDVLLLTCSMSNAVMAHLGISNISKARDKEMENCESE